VAHEPTEPLFGAPIPPARRSLQCREPDLHAEGPCTKPHRRSVVDRDRGSVQCVLLGMALRATTEKNPLHYVRAKSPTGVQVFPWMYLMSAYVRLCPPSY